jgi:hypothetical protein
MIVSLRDAALVSESILSQTRFSASVFNVSGRGVGTARIESLQQVVFNQSNKNSRKEGKNSYGRIRKGFRIDSYRYPFHDVLCVACYGS